MTSLSGDHWTDIEGKTWRLEAMDTQHQINVLNLIRERSLAIYLGNRIQDELFDPFEPEIIPAKELAFYIELEASMLAHLGLFEETLEASKLWVEEQPLVKRLKELTNENYRVKFMQKLRARRARNG